MDILCTHPMFGPDSGKGSWSGLNFMYEKVRIGRDARRQKRIDAFLKVRPPPSSQYLPETGAIYVCKQPSVIM